MLDKVLKAWECCDPFNRKCFECPYEDDCFHDGFDRVAIADMVKLLKEQEEKPLRCKNCSYYRDDGWCNEHRREVKKTDYCSFGAWNGR